MIAEDHFLGNEELEQRMRPGQLSQGGFLGNSESLQNVIDADALTLKTLGVDYAAIAGKLEELILAAMNKSEQWISTGKFKVSVTIYPGFQICPWSPDIHSMQCTAGGGVRYASVQWKIANNHNGMKLSGSGLAVHLIRDHHFFEGFDSPYRISPQDYIRLLGIKAI